VEEAASKRAHSSRLLSEAIKAALDAWSVSDLSLVPIDGPDVVTPQASRLSATLRFDAFFYGRGGALSDRVLEGIGTRLPVRALGEISEEVFETTRFGRKTVDDPAFGVPFLSISDLVRFDPRTDALVSRRQVEAVRADVRSGWLILPRVGQLQGVFGTVCYIPRHLDGVGVSDNNIRIVPKSEVDGAYLWAALSTKLLYQQIVRRACGTSIPYLDAKRVRQIPVPWPSNAVVRERIAERVIEAMECRSAASEAEDEARALVERAIEEAA
jgi:type I restriction enzyme S subunit